MPNDKLDKPKARANCGKCHHTFFLNSNLIKFADVPNDTTKTEDASPQNHTMPSPVTAAVPANRAAAIASNETGTTVADAQKSVQNLAQSATATLGSSAVSAVSRATNTTNQTAESISAKSSQTIAQLIKEKPELSTPHVLPKTQDNNSTTSPLVESDKFVRNHTELPVVQTAPDSLDGLDDFLKNNNPTNKIDTPAPKESQSDEWLDELLKDEKKPAKTLVSALSRSTESPKDSIGGAFDHIPTASSGTVLDKNELQKRAIQRLHAQSPSHEKISKSRGILGHFMWIVGSLILLGLMVAQYIIFNADEIAKRPSQAQLIHTICNNLSCNLPKADPNAFSNAYEIQAGNGKGANLIGTLQNNTGDNQLYPNLKVSVYGHNKFIGDFVVSPENYLTTPQRLLGANQGKRYMFTLIDVNAQDISKVQIEPFY